MSRMPTPDRNFIRHLTIRHHRRYWQANHPKEVQLRRGYLRYAKNAIPVQRAGEDRGYLRPRSVTSRMARIRREPAVSRWTRPRVGATLGRADSRTWTSTPTAAPGPIEGITALLDLAAGVIGPTDVRSPSRPDASFPGDSTSLEFPLVGLSRIGQHASTARSQPGGEESARTFDPLPPTAAVRSDVGSQTCRPQSFASIASPAAVPAHQTPFPTDRSPRGREERAR